MQFLSLPEIAYLLQARDITSGSQPPYTVSVGLCIPHPRPHPWGRPYHPPAHSGHNWVSSLSTAPMANHSNPVLSFMAKSPGFSSPPAGDITATRKNVSKVHEHVLSA